MPLIDVIDLFYMVTTELAVQPSQYHMISQKKSKPKGQQSRKDK